MKILPNSYEKEEELAAQAIFTDWFIDKFLKKIDLSDITPEQHEKIIVEMGQVLLKNLSSPKGVNATVCVYFYVKGLLASMIATKQHLDFKNFVGDFEKP